MSQPPSKHAHSLLVQCLYTSHELYLDATVVCRKPVVHHCDRSGIHLLYSTLIRNSRYLTNETSKSATARRQLLVLIRSRTVSIFKPSQRQHWRKGTYLRGGSCVEDTQQMDGWRRTAAKVRTSLAQFVHCTDDHYRQIHLVLPYEPL